MYNPTSTKLFLFELLQVNKCHTEILINANTFYIEKLNDFLCRNNPFSGILHIKRTLEIYACFPRFILQARVYYLMVHFQLCEYIKCLFIIHVYLHTNILRLRATKLLDGSKATRIIYFLAKLTKLLNCLINQIEHACLLRFGSHSKYSLWENFKLSWD